MPKNRTIEQNPTFIKVRRKIRRTTGFIVFFLIVALGAVIYPQGAQWFEQRIQSSAAETLAKSVKEDNSATVLSSIYENAEKYNKEVLDGIEHTTEDYHRQLVLNSPENFDVIGRLRIPKIDLDQPIRHGMSEYALTNGVGHAKESSLPIGGRGTHTILGGHRGMAESVGFTRLPELKAGDEIFIDVLGKTLTYRVSETDVLDPMVAEKQDIYPDQDLVTLLTCTPLGINSHRFVATAERYYPQPEPTPPVKSEEPGFPYWVVWFVVGLVGIVFVSTLLHKLSMRRVRKNLERQLAEKSTENTNPLDLVKNVENSKV